MYNLKNLNWLTNQSFLPVVADANPVLGTDVGGARRHGA